MTLSDIRVLAISADPDIRHYFTMSDEDAYSYWEESSRINLASDNGIKDEAWRFYLHHYTKTENSPIAQHIFDVLNADPRVGVMHTVDFDRESGYIHHIFECEGY